MESTSSSFELKYSQVDTIEMRGIVPQLTRHSELTSPLMKSFRKVPAFGGCVSVNFANRVIYLREYSGHVAPCLVNACSNARDVSSRFSRWPYCSKLAHPRCVKYFVTSDSREIAGNRRKTEEFREMLSSLDDRETLEISSPRFSNGERKLIRVRRKVRNKQK